MWDWLWNPWMEFWRRGKGNISEDYGNSEQTVSENWKSMRKLQQKYEKLPMIYSGATISKVSSVMLYDSKCAFGPQKNYSQA